MKLKDLTNKKILIVGYGKEGKATEEFLHTYVPSARITIVDMSQGPDYLKNQKEYDVAIKSPGIKPELISIPYTTATNLFFELVKGTTIGVTGTKGKSTTASLLFAILKQAGQRAHLVGNIGNPLLSELLISNTKEDLWVCELSSYQLMDIEYSPRISVLVSLFPEHMDYHGSLEEYYRAKGRIAAFATEKDTVVYNPDYPEITKLLEETKAIRVPFIPSLPFQDSNIPLLGQHNRDNLRGAVTVAQLLDVSAEDIKDAVTHFTPLRHRLQFVGTYKGISFYDDAISTTPESAIRALESLSPIGTLFLGGEDRGYDFSQLIDLVISQKIPNIVFFPESGTTMRKMLEKQSAYKPTMLETSSMEKAVAFAYQQSPKGSICLLSCASPSYSLWKNFEVKGDEFQELVRKYGENSSESK